MNAVCFLCLCVACFVSRVCVCDLVFLVNLRGISSVCATVRSSMFVSSWCCMQFTNASVYYSVCTACCMFYCVGELLFCF